jgi:hypothetical protein
MHIPRWLRTPGMGAEKIAAFYDDPVKQACDRFSIEKAHGLKAFSVDPGVHWWIRRQIKFLAHYAIGTLRALASHRHLPSVYQPVPVSPLLHNKDADVAR